MSPLLDLRKKAAIQVSAPKLPVGFRPFPGIQAGNTVSRKRTLPSRAKAAAGSQVAARRHPFFYGLRSSE